TADGAPRGVSDKAIDNGIEPDVAVRQMLDGMLAGEREIIVAEGAELAMGEARRTPEALLDQLGAFMAAGYAERMKADAYTEDR
ncbi:MAG: short-chain dehydrogenase, partial [Novosphingobium sp.]